MHNSFITKALFNYFLFLACTIKRGWICLDFGVFKKKLSDILYTPCIFLATQIKK